MQKMPIPHLRLKKPTDFRTVSKAAFRIGCSTLVGFNARVKDSICNDKQTRRTRSFTRIACRMATTSRSGVETRDAQKMKATKTEALVKVGKRLQDRCLTCPTLIDAFKKWLKKSNIEKNSIITCTRTEKQYHNFYSQCDFAIVTEWHFERKIVAIEKAVKT